MKKILVFLLALTLSLSSFAQDPRLTEMVEIAQVEADNGNVQLDVFSVPIDGQKTYYLSVGTMGIGTEIVQIDVDPITRLFIPLGNTLEEAMESLDKLKEMAKSEPGTTTEIDACFAPLIPNGNLEKVKVVSRKLLLSRSLEFCIEKEGYVRATYIPRSDLGAIASSVKFYKKIHPKEK